MEIGYCCIVIVPFKYRLDRSVSICIHNKYYGGLILVKKTEQDGGGQFIFLLIMGFLAAAQFALFGIVAIIHHRILMNRYCGGVNGNTAVRRINDVAAIFKPISVIFFGPTIISMFCILPFMAIISDPKLMEILEIIIYEIPFLLLWVWLSVILFKWLAVAHFGVIVDPTNDRIIFRYDQESYDLMDYIKLRFITDLPRLDEVHLSEIGRITRKRGDDLFLLGVFGSRRITFTNKQKRDECIFAIQNSGRTSAHVPVEFETL